MKVLELFSGTGVFSEVARSRGHTAITVDLLEPADVQRDVRTLQREYLEALVEGEYDLVWASPPCQGFSVASIGRMWKQHPDGTITPKHPTSEAGIELLRYTLALIKDLNPTAWFIENPRGMMRRMVELEPYKRQTVTFCQYGERRMKPTDIWTNLSNSWIARPACKNGDPCHDAAPRGSRTGTQGLTNARDRGRLPVELCEEIVQSVEWLDHPLQHSPTRVDFGV